MSQKAKRRGLDWSAAPSQGLSLLPLGAEPDGKILLGNEVDVRTQEVIDDSCKIRTSQSSVIGKSPPRIVPASGIIIVVELWSQARNKIANRTREAAVYLLVIPQRSLSQRKVASGSAPVLF